MSVQGATAARPTAPTTLKLTLWFALGAFVLNILSEVFVAMNKEAITKTVLDELSKTFGDLLDKDTMTKQAASAVDSAVTFGFVWAGIAGVLLVLFAFFAFKGQGWARVVLLIWSIIAIAAGLISTLVKSGEYPGSVTALGILAVLVQLGLCVTMFLSPSNQYIRSLKAMKLAAAMPQQPGYPVQGGQPGYPGQPAPGQQGQPGQPNMHGR